MQEPLTDVEKVQEQLGELESNFSYFDYLQQVTIGTHSDRDLELVIQVGVPAMRAVLNAWVGVDIDMCNECLQAIAESRTLLESNQPLKDVILDNELHNIECKMTIKDQIEALSEAGVDVEKLKKKK